jgi:hypothetical protein
LTASAATNYAAAATAAAHAAIPEASSLSSVAAQWNPLSLPLQGCPVPLSQLVKSLLYHRCRYDFANCCNDKKKISFSSYIRKFRVEQLQSQI